MTSEWNTDEPRPREFYVTTSAGRSVFEALLAEWRTLDAAVAAIAADDHDLTDAAGGAPR